MRCKIVDYLVSLLKTNVICSAKKVDLISRGNMVKKLVLKYIYIVGYSRQKSQNYPQMRYKIVDFVCLLLVFC
jgi:hypothetical protein